MFASIASGSIYSVTVYKGDQLDPVVAS